MGRFTNGRRRAYRAMRDPGAGLAEPMPLRAPYVIRRAFIEVPAHHLHGQQPCACVHGHAAEAGARLAGVLLA